MSKTTIAEAFQRDKETVALVSREGATWYRAIPVTLHQTLFPSFFQPDRQQHDET
ncbi:hypothetical protein [Halalkalibacter oceani]|uniref:Uncharacterized protein n=1 Tax=Halalkalibacter oceani TaxID=1653776 RepID=A0A9X2IN91_9BACI|nr:hypothetical protein [Halalkalibacter oceani]MCM3713556.1 hypothetical protein [Halalkalibacter oceani]